MTILIDIDSLVIGGYYSRIILCTFHCNLNAWHHCSGSHYLGDLWVIDVVLYKNAIKGDISEHFDVFKIKLNQGQWNPIKTATNWPWKFGGIIGVAVLAG